MKPVNGSFRKIFEIWGEISNYEDWTEISTQAAHIFKPETSTLIPLNRIVISKLIVIICLKPEISTLIPLNRIVTFKLIVICLSQNYCQEQLSWLQNV
jgi:hypothetical protein